MLFHSDSGRWSFPLHNDLLRDAIGTVRARRSGSMVDVVMFTCSLRVASTSALVSGGSSSSEELLSAFLSISSVGFFFGALIFFALGSCLCLERPSDFPSAFFFSTSSLSSRRFSSS